MATLEEMLAGLDTPQNRETLKIGLGGAGAGALALGGSTFLGGDENEPKADRNKRLIKNLALGAALGGSAGVGASALNRWMNPNTNTGLNTQKGPRIFSWMEKYIGKPGLLSNLLPKSWQDPVQAVGVGGATMPFDVRDKWRDLKIGVKAIGKETPKVPFVNSELYQPNQYDLPATKDILKEHKHDLRSYLSKQLGGGSNLSMGAKRNIFNDLAQAKSEFGPAQSSPPPVGPPVPIQDIAYKNYLSNNNDITSGTLGNNTFNNIAGERVPTWRRLLNLGGHGVEQTPRLIRPPSFGGKLLGRSAAAYAVLQGLRGFYPEMNKIVGGKEYIKGLPPTAPEVPAQ